MRLFSTLFVWLLLGCAVMAQINPNQPTTPRPATRPAAAPAAPAMATVRVEWVGSSPAKLYLNRQEVLLVPGKPSMVQLKPDFYEVELRTPEVLRAAEYLAITEAGSGVLQVSVVDGKLKANYMSQAAAADFATKQRQLVSGLERDMVRIAGGSYTMGCTGEQGSDCYENEKPSHRVTVSTFYLSKYEVTQGLWTAVMGSNPSSNAGCDQCPVGSVSWNDVQEFLRKLNAQSGKRYRLPTEAEWEYAARGGGQSRGTKYAGGNDVGSVGWYEGNSGGKTQGVGKKSPNELGLYDMTGNVWEWCSDWYGVSHYGSSASIDPQGPSSGDKRVVRGGSWHSVPWGSRLAYRAGDPPDARGNYLGFRLARTE